jgi:cytochrome c peroxidase
MQHNRLSEQECGKIPTFFLGIDPMIAYISLPAAVVRGMLVIALILTGVAFAQPYSSRTQHVGLPAVPDVPHDIDAAHKISLGRKLFFDKRLSRDGTISCASCHQPERAFADSRSIAQGIGGRLGTRNSPSLINSVFQASQFWDGRRGSLEEQALDPLLNKREHGMPDQKAILAVLKADPVYVRQFAKAFPTDGSSVTVQNLARALAAFESTLIAADSAFDRYFYQQNSKALSPKQQRGLALFTGTAQCVRCHEIGANSALLSDNQFHNLSVGIKNIENRLASLTMRLATQHARGASIDSEVLNDREIAELGRFAVTLEPADIGKFRTPSLRNVALTAPYMHDGSIATLDAAVEYELYYRSAERGFPLILTPDEKSDLVAFLESLTSSPAALAKLGHTISSGTSAVTRSTTARRQLNGVSSSPPH